MSQSDPTDHALAAIASILDQPEARREPTPGPQFVPEEKPAAQPVEANGYTKVGPGPMPALRFRWTVREDNDHYYVDETIGDNSAPIVNGPLTREAAIRMVDDRENEARQRFDDLKGEMAGRSAVANLVRRDNSES